MDDLLFHINYKESNKFGNLIVETFSGKIKKLKNKTFSGQILKTDIFNNEYGNINNSELSIIKDILLISNNVKINKNKYMISIDSFYELCTKTKFNTFLYYTSQDKKMNIIEDILIDKDINISFENSIRRYKVNLYYSYNNQNKNLSSKMEVLLINKYSLIYDKNKIILMKANLNIPLLKNIFKSKCIIKKEEVNLIKEKLVNYSSRCENQVFVSRYVKPVMYISLDHNICGKLKIDYYGIEIDENCSEEYILYKNKKYARNKAIENEFIDILISEGWNKGRNNKYIFNKKYDIAKSLDRLMNKGFTIYTSDNKKLRSYSNFNIKMSYHNDWFEIDGHVKLDNKMYNLSQLIDMSDKNNYIQVGKESLILPAFIKDLNKNISNEKILIKKTNVGQVLEISHNLKIDKIDNIDEFTDFKKIDIDIYEKILLRDYQIEGVKWLKYLYKNKMGGCLADDMGLGKTIQVIAFLTDSDVIKTNRLCFIIVPKTLLSNWEKEIKRFSDNLLNIDFYYGNSRKENINLIKSHGGIFLTTYTTILNDIDLLSDLKIDSIVLDEVQYIKNSESKTYKAISRLNTNCRIALSGTPFENNVGEVWSIMNLLNKGIFGSKHNFMSRYNDIDSTTSHLKDLKIRIKPYILRRNKKDVLNMLPEKFEKNIYCNMETNQDILYKSLLLKIKNELKNENQRYKIKSNAIFLEGLLYLRQICCHPQLLKRQYNINNCNESGKFEVFKMKIEEIVANKSKVIVFSQFTKMLKIMEDWIRFNNWKYFYMDGETKNRQVVVNEFEKSDEGIFLISLKAGGVGLNLTSCNYVIIYDPWWNPAVEEQASDRVYRIGQNKDVFIYKLITVDSIEEKIERLKENKSKIGNSIFNDMDRVNSISIKDIKDIF